MSREPRVLVAGATGLVGRAAVDHFAARDGWAVAGLSRRPLHRADVRHVPADLTDADACRAAVAAAGPFTHVLYAALYERRDVVAGWRDPEQMETNRAMLAHLLDAVEASSPGLRRVIALQGGKAYGVHLRRVPVPAKERWPRASHEIFYWAQEDLLRERAGRGGWSYSILRPQRILGDALGSPLSIVAALGVYAAVWRELGRPLEFPGGGRYVNACSDSRLIARAVEFCATEDAAAGQTFNVVNGDLVVWRDLWPAVAARFGMRPGGDRPLRLAEEMPRHGEVWRRLAERHGLRHAVMDDVTGRVWAYADLVLGAGLDRPDDNVMSPVKLCQAGFTDCMDTEDAVVHWLDRLQRQRVLPR